MSARKPGARPGVEAGPAWSGEIDDEEEGAMTDRSGREDGVGARVGPIALAVALFAAGACQGPAGEQGPPEMRAASGGESGAPGKEIVVPAEQGLPFSPAVRAGDLLFLSGQVGNRPGTLELVEGGIQAETRQTMEKIRATLEEAGATMEDVVKCTVFLADIAEWEAMNEVYREFFPSGPPARSAMGVSGLALDARVEIECIAVAP